VSEVNPGAHGTACVHCTFQWSLENLGAHQSAAELVKDINKIAEKEISVQLLCLIYLM
jgi:hypothetical protein